MAGEGVKLKNFLTTAMTDLRQDLVDFGLDLKDNTIGVTNAVTGTVRGVLRGENPLAARDSTRTGSGAGAGIGSQAGDVEMGDAHQQDGSDNKAVFFKHHKVQKSKNVLAEEELERSVRLPIPMVSTSSSIHTLLSKSLFKYCLRLGLHCCYYFWCYNIS